MSSFYHLQPLTQKVKSYNKDIIHFLSKLKSLGVLPQGVVLGTIDAVGLYPNIPYNEGLAFLRRFLELITNKWHPYRTR